MTFHKLFNLSLDIGLEQILILFSSSFYSFTFVKLDSDKFFCVFKRFLIALSLFKRVRSFSSDNNISLKQLFLVLMSKVVFSNLLFYFSSLNNLKNLNILYLLYGI